MNDRVALAAALMSLAAAGCGGQSADRERPPLWGKADGLGPDGIGSRCAADSDLEYSHLVVKTREAAGLSFADDGTLVIGGTMSAEMRSLMELDLSGLALDIGSAGVPYPESVTTMLSSVAAFRPDDQRRLSSYITVTTSGLDQGEIESLCLSVAQHSFVELVYPMPLAETPDTPDLTTVEPWVDSYVDYLAAADQGGFGWRPIAAQPGANGDGIRIADVETGVQVNHEDFPTIEILGETPPVHDHGTAVLGIVAAQDNGLGTRGFVPNAVIGFTGTGSDVVTDDHPQRVAAAISRAADFAGPNGIILIEQHSPAPINFVPSGAASCASPNFTAMEYFPAVRDVVQAATRAGIHVVEAGGNGSVDLDRALPDRRILDSGAIIVGASKSDFSQPSCYSNFGEAVDLHAWGENVTTTGYGDHPVHAEVSSTATTEYTHRFAGTSSASPIVVGVAASVLGMVKAATGETVEPEDLRQLLIRTGRPQGSLEAENNAGSFRPIGAAPDVSAAWNAYQNELPTAVFEVEDSGGQSFVFRDLSVAKAGVGAGIVRREIDFGDGQKQLDATEVDHHYAAPGTYVVTLRVFTQGGLFRTSRRAVVVDASPNSVSADGLVLQLANTATASELEANVGLGSDTAANVVGLRPFANIGELLPVPGLGGEGLAKLYQAVGEP